MSTNGAALRVFGRRGDPGRIALQIARAIPGAAVRRNGDAYRVKLANTKGLFRQSAPLLLVEIDTGRFGGRHGGAAVDELRAELVGAIRGPGLDEVLSALDEVRISVTFTPAAEERLRPTDPLALLALDVAARADGFVLDLHNGRLLSMTGELLGTTAQLLADGGSPVDPSRARIERRLVVLVAVAARTLTEYDGRDLQEARAGIAQWVHAAGASAELEPHEAAILQRPAGQVDDAELAYGTWQIEAAAVLAWALELLDELPPYDQAIDPSLLSATLGFPDAGRTRTVLAAGRRRFQALVDAEAERHQAIHTQLAAAVARGEATADEVDLARTITAERLRACSWLRTGGPYADTPLA